MKTFKIFIQWLLSKLFPFDGEKLSGKDNYDDYYLDESEVTIGLRRSDEKIIKQLNS